MNQPSSLWNDRPGLLLAGGGDVGGAAGERASSPTISAAASPAGDAIDGVASSPCSAFSMICAAAETTSALIHTM